MKMSRLMFERYVNFEFYKTDIEIVDVRLKFERYVNFEFYKTIVSSWTPTTSLRDM